VVGLAIFIPKGASRVRCGERLPKRRDSFGLRARSTLAAIALTGVERIPALGTYALIDFGELVRRDRLPGHRGPRPATLSDASVIVLDAIVCANLVLGFDLRSRGRHPENDRKKYPVSHEIAHGSMTPARKVKS
jgi:hypothetical protein